MVGPAQEEELTATLWTPEAAAALVQTLRALNKDARATGYSLEMVKQE